MDDVDDPNYVVENEETDDENDEEDVGDGIDEQVGVCYEPVEETHAQLTKERNVRGPTKMKSIIATQGKLKIYVKINRYGQPCGIKTCNFTNFIAVLVKGGDISLKHKDWRMVPAEDKEKIWTLVNKYFTIDPICKEWVMASASKKWRDFKNTLKKIYFDEDLSEEENIANGCKNRIPSSEWAWLVEHWSKEETKAKAQKNKDVRQNQVNALHTCGSRSYAVVSHQLENELGREPSRAELYIVTHTKANGQSLNEACQQKIDVIRERIENDESLRVKSIEDGDLYADVFPKEQKGRIRGLGLLPGGSKSIALARATAAVRQMEVENAELRERMENAERRCERSEQNYSELKNMLLAIQREGSKGVVSPAVGSTEANDGGQSVRVDDCARFINASNEGRSISHENEPRQSVGGNNCARSSGAGNEKRSIGCENEPRIAVLDKITQTLHVEKGTRCTITKNGGQSSDSGRKVSTANRHKGGRIIHENVLGKSTANGLQLQSSSSDNEVLVDGMNQTRIRKLELKQDGDGNEVALRSLTGSNIVAYGRLRCTNKKAKGLDGLPLGDYYEVIVDVVLDKNVLLPRVQGQATKLGAAIGRCIAWPFQNVVKKDGSPLNMTKRAIDFRKC